MPSKKKKYNSRFPPARIKKIMQSDEEVGKVAQVVPIIISKALEIFVAQLLNSSSNVTRSRNARTLTPNHIKASILSDDQFHFLREIAQTIPDVNPGAEADEEEGAAGSATGMATTPTTAGSFSATAVPHMSVGHRQRKASENRTTTATITSQSSGHELSATGQAATAGFRQRGRPRKRPLESQSSSISTVVATVDEPEDDEETEEEEEEDEEAEDEEECQPLKSNNNNINNRIMNSNQQIISNNNFNPINNYYYSTNTITTHPSIQVSTIQCMSSSSVAASSSVTTATEHSMTPSLVLKPQKGAIDEDDDYDN